MDGIYHPLLIRYCKLMEEGSHRYHGGIDQTNPDAVIKVLKHSLKDRTAIMNVLWSTGSQTFGVPRGYFGRVHTEGWKTSPELHEIFTEVSSPYHERPLDDYL